jgi:hypothetical protein
MNALEGVTVFLIQGQFQKAIAIPPHGHLVSLYLKVAEELTMTVVFGKLQA